MHRIDAIQVLIWIEQILHYDLSQKAEKRYRHLRQQNSGSLEGHDGPPPIFEFSTVDCTVLPTDNVAKCPTVTSGTHNIILYPSDVLALHVSAREGASITMEHT